MEEATLTTVAAAPAASAQAAKEAFLSDWPKLSITASSADYYFDSYNHYGVHEDVLKDTETTAAFQRAIKQNAHLFRGMVVLDVSAGLGINALFAVQAGAKKVIALETQPELVAMGSMVAAKNGFGPEVIEFVCGTASTLEQLPGGLECVDIIVSGWMGYFLTYEARLGEVLKARDRWLKADGLLFPDRAKQYVALIEDAEYKRHHFEYYDAVWGFDFSAMKGAAHSEPVVNTFAEDRLISAPACVLDLNLHHCTADDCFQWASSMQLVCKREGKAHGMLSWFEIRFECCHKPVFFSTGPESNPTCWKQTAFFFDGEPLSLKHKDRVRAMLAVRKVHENRRNMDIKISCRVNSGKPLVQFYRWL